MSLGSILSTAKSGLLAQQKLVDTASHNIANASTDGYTRQRVRLEVEEPLRTPQGLVGRGVIASTVERVRSTFLDDQFRTETGTLGQQSATKDLMTQVGAIMGDLEAGSLSAGLDAFYNSFADLSADPSSLTARTLARQSADDLARQFNSLDSRIADIRGSAIEQLSTNVTEINRLTAQISDLNRQVVASFRGGAAPDLEDKRDQAIDALSKLVQVRTIRDDRGGATVLMGDFVVADLARSETVSLTAQSDGSYALNLDGGAVGIDPKGGEVAGLLGVVNTAIPGVTAQLDTLAGAIVTRANALHSAGVTGAGTTGIPLFDPAGTTAGTMALSTQVSGNLANLVTGATTAAGDGSVALQLSQLRTETQAGLSNRTFGEFYVGITSSVATQANAAATRVTAQEALVSNITTQKSSVSGVSIDEEMVMLLKAQQAYAAAAKVISTANEMMASVLQMI